MKRKMRTLGLVIALLFISSVSLAVMYTWTDPDGSYHATDRTDKLPRKYRDLVRYDLDHYTTPAGIGFDKDEKGNFIFYDHASPGAAAAKRTPPPDVPGPPGSAVTPQQFQEIQLRYHASGLDPRPQINEGKVKRIISGDTFELDDGQKVTYVGIEFPDELKGDTKVHKDSVEYQKKIMQGRTVNLIYGLQKTDEKGRLMAYVFVGKDMFVNADLVMNGYARVKTGGSPNTEYTKLFLRLQDFAKRSMLGMWDAGSAAPTQK
ncbi:MAG TPA: thermonuclease family protein [bacterium]|nr:thermonuclease family protein [bacterium]